MKKFLLLSMVLISYLGYAQCNDPLITDFECSEPSHPITGALVTVANPVSGGINTSANVGEYTDNGTEGFDALVVDYGTAIDLTTNSILKFKLYSPRPIQVLAKLENTTNREIYSDFSEVNEWQEFTYDFSAFEGEGNTKLVLFFNAAKTDGTPTDIYYIDDLKFDAPAQVGTPCEDPIITDFECSAPSHPITGALVTIANPVSGGINTSENVGRYTDNGTEGFDALVVDYGAAIDLSTNPILKLKLYSPTSIQILAKLENTTNREIYSDFSEVNTWQEFEFDFSAFASEGNTKVVLFFNVAVNSGTTTDIYYIDDLKFASATASVTADALASASLYPNPAKDILNITSLENVDSFQILDLLGKTIVNQPNNTSNAIDISALRSGIYFVRLQTQTSESVIRFIKQ